MSLGPRQPLLPSDSKMPKGLQVNAASPLLARSTRPASSSALGHPWPRRDTSILGLVHTCRTEGPVAWASVEPPPVSLREVPLRSQVTDEETGCRSQVNQARVNLTSALLQTIPSNLLQVGSSLTAGALPVRTRSPSPFSRSALQGLGNQEEPRPCTPPPKPPSPHSLPARYSQELELLTHPPPPCKGASV